MTTNTMEFEKLRLWLDIEITLLHIGFYILLGLELDTKKWWLAIGLMIFISFIYSQRRVRALAKIDKNYLKIPVPKDTI